MGTFYANDNSGKPYRIYISGDSPTPSETKNIERFIAGKNAALPQPEVPPETGVLPWLREAGKGTARGLEQGLVSSPLRAVGGIGDYLMGNQDPGLLSRVGTGIDEGMQNTIGAAPGWENSYASTIGELGGMAGSFIIPGMGASRLVASPLVESNAN